MLLSRTVLSDLYLEKLVTDGDVERMEGEGGLLSDRVVPALCARRQKVVNRTTGVLDKYGYDEEARQLRGW